MPVPRMVDPHLPRQNGNALRSANKKRGPGPAGDAGGSKPKAPTFDNQKGGLNKQNR